MTTENTPSAPSHQGALPFKLPEPGSTITSPITTNTYTIGERIDEGNFGVVFGCTDVWGNDLVAKVLKDTVGAFEIAEQKALDEITALSISRHPNIVYVHDAFAYHGACYIVSERCGQTLKAWFSDPTYQSSVWFRAIARCVLQAVHFAHVQGIAHCDIHLGNIFSHFIADEVLPQKHQAVTFKLGDFGLAKRWDCVAASGTFLDSIRPPEAIEPNEFGPTDTRVDIYHLGLVLLQAYYGEILTFTRDEILAGEPRGLALQLPPPYSFALEKMLRRHVAYRTQTALEAWRDLNSPAP